MTTTAQPAAPTVEQRLAVAEDYLQSTVEVTSWAAQQIELHAARLTALEGLVQQLVSLVGQHQREVKRLGPQLASLELREGRRSAPVVLTTPSPEELEGARSLVAELRSEHERMRARTALVTSFEERIRRLEAR